MMMGEVQSLPSCGLLASAIVGCLDSRAGGKAAGESAGAL